LGIVASHVMSLLRAFGFVVLALVSIFTAFAAFGVETPGLFERAPAWLRVVLLVGACIYLAWWFIADFHVVRSWFRRGGSSQ
jgi:hypothetical protein